MGVIQIILTPAQIAFAAVATATDCPIVTSISALSVGNVSHSLPASQGIQSLKRDMVGVLMGVRWRGMDTVVSTRKGVKLNATATEAAYLSEDDLGSGSSECWLAREAWGTWRFHGARLPASAAYHGMLVPDLAAYACERQDFLLLARSEDQAPALHYRFLNRRVDLPLHPSWADWIWDRGLASGETEVLHSVGIHAYRCRPDVTQLEEDINAGVCRGLLTVPDEDEMAEAA